MKNAAYWNPRLTIASIAELGIKYAIEQVEKEHGGPYPQRETETQRRTAHRLLRSVAVP